MQKMTNGSDYILWMLEAVKSHAREGRNDLEIGFSSKPQTHLKTPLELMVRVFSG